MYTIGVNSENSTLIVMEATMIVPFIVSLFGHRQIEDWRQLDDQFTRLIKKLLQTKTYVSFLIGRNGEFDEYAASMIKTVQRETGKENSDITLVLPYTVANMEYYESYYDSIVIPDCVYRAHPKTAITQRNRWMIEQADLVIIYIERNNGGAYSAWKYAKKQDKQIICLDQARNREDFP